MKFKSDIEVQAGLKDSSGAAGTSGQVLSSNGTTVSWVNAGSSVASDVQNQVKAGVAINKGQAVYVTSADGTNIIVGLASNTSEATSSKTLGLLNATVAINGFADVVQIGKLAGLNTIGATVGDPVWLGANGNLIYGLANKPYAPLHLVYIGVVTRVNANNGEIFINVQNGFELKEIHDVSAQTPSNNNGIFYNTSNGLWEAKAISAAGGIEGSGTTNYVPKFTGASTIGNSLIFDNGSGVGISTTSLTGRSLVVATAPTGSASYFGVNQNGLVQSSVTNIMIGYNNSAQTAASAFNLPEYIHFRAFQATFGATSTVASQTGFRADSTLIGATNNYGFFGAIPSGSNRWNLYMDGTANNYLAGNLLIGTSTDAGYKLDVNGTLKVGGSSGAVTTPTAITMDGTYRTGALSFDSLKFYLYKSPTETYGFGLGNLGEVTYWAGTASTGVHAFYTSQTERMRITSAGNVGIGTTTVPNTLSVGMASSTTGKGISLTSSAGIEYARFGVINSTVDNTSFIGSISNNNFAIYANNAERMRIASTGAVTINNLSGTGSRMVIANSTGQLSTQAITLGTVTSVAALTIGTTGTDITSTVANETTTPVITLNVPTASASNRGALSAADWTTFNNKQNALTNPVTGTGTTNYIPKFTGASAIGNSAIYDNSGNIGIGITSATQKLVVDGGSTDGAPIFAKSSLLSSGKYYSGVLTGFATTTNQSAQFGYVYDTVTPANSFAHITNYGSAEGSQFSIKTNGNVGVGTKNAGVRLVNSGAALTEAPTLGSGVIGADAILSTNGLYGIYTGVSSAGYVWQQVQRNDGSSTTYALSLQPASGNVLIGITVDAGYKLDVNGSARIRGNGYVFFDTTGASASNYIGVTNDYWTTMYCGRGDTARIDLTNGSGILFSTSNAQRMSISAAGAVKVANLGGTGTRLVTASSDGTLSTTTDGTITSYNSTLTLNTSWQNTGIDSTVITASGVYLVTCFANDNAVGGAQYSCTYVGTMYFYASGTNGVNANEIALHHSGHADNGRYIYLRTLGSLVADSKLYLQIKGNGTNTGNSTYVFTFKKLL